MKSRSKLSGKREMDKINKSKILKNMRPLKLQLYIENVKIQWKLIRTWESFR